MKNRLKIVVIVAIGLLSRVAVAQSQQEGLRAIENDRLDKAYQIFNNLVKTSPNNADNYYYLGALLLENRKLDSAKMMFTKGVSVDPQNPLPYIGLGKLALEADNSAEYKKNFDKALSVTGTKDVRPYILIANAYTESSNKRGADALAVLNKGMAIDPKNPELYIAMGDAYITEGNGGQAVSSYEKSIQLNKNNPKAYTRIGSLYIKARNGEEAMKALQNAIKVDSTYVPEYKELGELYYLTKKYDKAVETIQKYMVMTDYSLAAKARYAQFLFLNKEYAKSTAVINEVIKKDSSNVVMKRLLGYSFYEQKEYPKALQYMQGFFAKADKKKLIASDFEYYGKIQSKLNQDSLAIDNFKKALEIDPSKTDLYQEIANSYNKLKKFPEAIKYLELKMSTSKVTNTDIFLLGRTFYFAGDYTKADSMFAKLNASQPTYLTGFVWRARVVDAADSKEPKTFAAKPFYDKIIELGTADPQKNKGDLIIAYQYQRFYSIQKDDKAGAKSANEKILELDPENAEAKEIQKQLNSKK